MKKALIMILLISSGVKIYSQINLDSIAQDILQRGIELSKMMNAYEDSKNLIKNEKEYDWDRISSFTLLEEDKIIVIYPSKTSTDAFIFNYTLKTNKLNDKKVSSLKKSPRNISTATKICNDILDTYTNKDGYLEFPENGEYSIYLFKLNDSYSAYRLERLIDLNIITLKNHREYIYDIDGNRKVMKYSKCSARDIDISKSGGNVPSNYKFKKHVHFNDGLDFISVPAIAKTIMKWPEGKGNFKIEVHSTNFVSIFNPNKTELKIYTIEEFKNLN